MFNVSYKFLNLELLVLFLSKDFKNIKMWGAIGQQRLGKDENFGVL